MPSGLRSKKRRHRRLLSANIGARGRQTGSGTGNNTRNIVSISPSLLYVHTSPKRARELSICSAPLPLRSLRTQNAWNCNVNIALNYTVLALSDSELSIKYSFSLFIPSSLFHAMAMSATAFFFLTLLARLGWKSSGCGVSRSPIIISPFQSFLERMTIRQRRKGGSEVLSVVREERRPCPARGHELASWLGSAPS